MGRLVRSGLYSCILGLKQKYPISYQKESVFNENDLPALAEIRQLVRPLLRVWV